VGNAGADLVLFDTDDASTQAIGPLGHAGIGYLSWDSTTGRLFGVRIVDGSGDGLSNLLMTVDPVTLEATQVATVTGTVQGDADRMFFVGDTLYVTDSYLPAATFSTSLYTLNRATGVATLVAETTPEVHLIGITADPITMRVFGTDANDPPTLYDVDLATAALTEIGPVAQAGAIAAVIRDCD
jgi:hypothetical protein